MQERFYVSHNGEEVGPFSAEEIFAKLKNQELWSVDYVYIDERADWITLEEFESLHDGDTDKMESPFPEPPMVEVEPITEDIEPVTLVTKHESMFASLLSGGLPVKTKNIEPTTAAVNTKVDEPAAEFSEPVKLSEPVKTVDPVKAVVSTSLGTIELVDGVAVVELTHERAELLKLTLVDLGKKSLNLALQPEIQVKAGPAKQISLVGETKAVAGENLTLQMQALDAFGNIDSNFGARVTVQVGGSGRGGGSVTFQKGKAQCTVTNTVAEKTTITLTDLPKSLDSLSPHTIHFVAGPASQYVIDTPKEIVAGQPTKVTIRAVDAYGNLATEEKGPIQLVKNGDVKHAS